MEGRTVSHYQVLERLGGGGMGVVYKAQDTRLGRVVALKFLPPDMTRDEAAKQRFVQEARAASALDHSNICTIFDVDETSDGQMFLVMAYYAGETLKKKIERGPLKLDDALDVAIQVAQGLARAHESGIVHRDVKPANVMTTDRGEVKVVDFGLAKLAGQSGLTQTGTTLGTVSYMSPEQVLGEQVDQRTDIWSLGVVLYEMVSGQLPFKGEHTMVISNAILQHTPAPLTAVRTGVPMELERIVTRTLSKRRDDRYQTMADFLSELRRLRRESSDSVQSVASVSVAAPARRIDKMAYAAALVAVLIVAGAVAAYFLLRSREDGVPLLTNPTQVTSATGVEDFPTWSPDGRALAYASAQSGNSDIWVVQPGAGQPVNRTADHQGADGFPSWSPDGSQIAFTSAREGGGCFVMSALGGPARKIGTSVGNPPRWSPDGKELACTRFDGSDAWIDVFSISSGESRRVPLPGRKGQNRFDLAWSPDGKYFAYVDARDRTAQVTRLWILDLAAQKGIPVTEGRTNEWSPSWSSDSRTLYFVSNRGGKSMDLWGQRIGEDGALSGAPQRVTTGIGMLRAALSPDGRKLAYSRGRQVANLWRVPILADRAATWADATQLTFDEAFTEFVDVSPDGQQLVISSDRNGQPDLWTMPIDGGELRAITTDPTPDWNAAWSPNGAHIAFYGYRSGNRDLWTMPAGGGPARQVTREESEDYFSGWSPDGRELVFYSNRGGNEDIWVVPAGGGAARQLTDHPGSDAWPVWSPDGKWIVFASTRAGGPSKLWRVPAAGGPAEPMTRGAAWRSRFSADGNHLYFTLPGPTGNNNLGALTLADRSERLVTNLTGKWGALPTAGLATDGRYLYFLWAQPAGDIWVMDVADESR